MCLVYSLQVRAFEDTGSLLSGLTPPGPKVTLGSKYGSTWREFIVVQAFFRGSWVFSRLSLERIQALLEAIEPLRYLGKNNVLILFREKNTKEKQTMYVPLKIIEIKTSALLCRDRNGEGTNLILHL